MNTGKDRISKLRQHALSQDVYAIRSREGQLQWYRGWMENADAPSAIFRRAKAKAHHLRHATAVIDDGELIVGKPCYRPLDGNETEELHSYEKTVQKAMMHLSGQASHMAVDYEKLLTLGIEGIMAQITNTAVD